MSTQFPSQQPNPFAPVFRVGNSVQRFHEPGVPAERGLIDFQAERDALKFGPENVFALPPADAAPPRLSGVRTLVLDLSVARTDFLVEVPGNVIFFENSTNVTDKVTFKGDGKDMPSVPYLPGNATIGLVYDRLFITNAVIAGAVATILLMNVPNAKLQLQ